MNTTGDHTLSIVARLHDRLKLRYMPDCKCGHCSVVPLLREAADEIERLTRRSCEATIGEPDDPNNAA